MDDTQNPNLPSGGQHANFKTDAGVGAPVSQGIQQPVQASLTQTQLPVSTPASTGTQLPVTTPIGGMKEGSPVAAPTEWVSPSVPEVVPTQEVSQFVEVHPEVPPIPQAARLAGVKHAKEATPVQSLKAAPLGLATPHPVLVVLKNAHKNIKDSMSWLVSLIMKEQDREKHTKVHKEKGDFFS